MLSKLSMRCEMCFSALMFGGSDTSYPSRCSFVSNNSGKRPAAKGKSVRGRPRKKPRRDEVSVDDDEEEQRRLADMNLTRERVAELYSCLLCLKKPCDSSTRFICPSVTELEQLFLDDRPLYDTNVAEDDNNQSSSEPTPPVDDLCPNCCKSDHKSRASPLCPLFSSKNGRAFDLKLELLNFLADGMETREWSSGTVNNYHSAILNLFPDRLSCWISSTFRDFFRHLSSNAIKRFINTPAPVLDHFRGIGPNSDLKPSQLLQSCAGCWLRAVSCAHQMDVSHSSTFVPLIRHTFDLNQAASTDTIGRHITKISDLLPLPNGMEKAPSGRSLGSSLAIEHDASSDKVQAQGFWAHSATYDSFYRLSRRSVKDLTQLMLAD
ncbi:hypothetical protein BGZ47_006137 [Haplosporangium gracile]|nr:hypothetical protein BGZ47_006137 [Haplosporangium gracile]